MKHTKGTNQAGGHEAVNIDGRYTCRATAVLHIRESGAEQKGGCGDGSARTLVANGCPGNRQKDPCS